MLKWLRNRLKWWIAGDEMAEVERWRIRCAEYDRWLASYPDIALVLQNLHGVAQGQIESMSGAPPEWGPMNIHALRQQVEWLRPHGVTGRSVGDPQSQPDVPECCGGLSGCDVREYCAARGGYKMVPIEPTLDMLYAMAECDGYERGDRDHPMLTRWEDYWRMALSAAPDGVGGNDGSR